MKLKNLTYLFIGSLLIFNCSDSGGDDLSTQEVTYNTQIKSISNVDIILNRINNTEIPMPPTGLMPATNRELIQRWKDEGLVEN